MIDQFRIPNGAAQGLAERNLPLPTLLQRAGLPPGFFEGEKTYATTSEFFALWRAIGELSPDPAIGLKIGTVPRFERYHPAGIAAVCSRSFGDALQRVARYKQMTCPEEIRVLVAGEEAAVEFLFPMAEEAEPEVLVDLALSWILSIGRRGSDGRITPLRVELTRPSRHRESLENHFGCRIRFKTDRNAIVFRRSDLETPFVTHNEELLTAIGGHLEAEIQAHQAGTTIGEQVKRTLKRSLAGSRPSLQQLARGLGMSPRTLQRRLTDAGLTFQQMVEETRHELARYYLEHTTVELNEVAYLVGYGDANSFFRAFQHWEGTSPGEWRAGRKRGHPAGS
jgi:AraC-like DNA-binding protein